MIEKRMAEIKARKLEIRESLQGESEINLEEVKAELDNLEVEERSLIEKREIAEKINVGEIKPVIIEKPKAKEELRMENIFESMEYRQAFMNYVLAGEKLPQEFRANTKTTDIGAMIPQTVLAKIVEKMEATGMILPLVTRTAIKGGVTVPTSAVKPVASWVAEGASSEKQNKTTGTISFTYNKLRCAVSISLEVSEMALGVFEATLINNVVEAMTKAIEQSILTGTGSGQPKGILTETPAAGQEIQVAKAKAIDYKLLCEAEAALPLAYETGAVWLMTKKTFMAFASLTDLQGQPIGRVNYGLNGAPERTLLGRRVILNDYMTNYDAAGTSDHIFAALFNMSDYVLNTNLNIGLKKYEDNETDDQVTKAVMLVDGKVVDKNSLVTLKKLNS